MASSPGKNADNGVVEFQFYKPDNRTKWEAFQKAIYDKSSNQFLGRTPKSWGQLLVFYSIFYVVLAALFAICMQALFATLHDREPKWKLGSSLIGDNPGLGFRPISNKTEEGSLIWYNVTNATTSEKWIKLVDEFLIPYRQNQSIKNFVDCNFTSPPPEGEVCRTTPDQFENCGPERKYGYGSASPCIFLKLNRIIDWQPKYFTSPQEGMPQALSSYIAELEKDNSTERRIWVSCNGVNDVDKESIKGFNYYPKGFSSFYYPFKNVENYLSPIVAVELIDVRPNIVIQVECRAWASNVKYVGGTLNRAGSVTFEIQVDGAYDNPSSQPTKSEKLEATMNPENQTVDVTTTVTPEISTPNATTVVTTATS